MSNYDLTINKAKKEFRDQLILKFMIESSSAIIQNAYQRYGTQEVEKEAYDFAERAADLYLEKTGLGIKKTD